MKKKGMLAFGGFALSLIMVNLVSAFYYDPRSGMNDLIRYATDFLEPLFNALLGGSAGGWTSYLLFEKILLFVILMALVYLSLKNIRIFSENNTVLWIIAIAVPLLGVRFLDFVWLNTIFVQYKVLAFVLTAGLPFIIYFLFLYNVLSDYDALRKIGWIFFGVVFLFMWAASEDYTFSEVYFWTAVVAFIFLLLDGTIRRAMIRMQRRALGMQNNQQFETEIRRQMHENEADYNTRHIIDQKVYLRRKKAFEKQIDALYLN